MLVYTLICVHMHSAILSPMKIETDKSWMVTQTSAMDGDIWEDGRMSLVLKECQCEC